MMHKARYEVGSSQMKMHYWRSWGGILLGLRNGLAYFSMYSSNITYITCYKVILESDDSAMLCCGRARKR
ncbi:hypothetical protein EYC80_005671 [Monilinia laxa]|uniref:Uncharacterized protein n=1 Tax=Monilinia laxa TaxID=61186 RepID=A0A5N6KEV4_MONLA|nr:hypothetical protein EYC80_005671 [Monilinia laxa]